MPDVRASDERQARLDEGSAHSPMGLSGGPAPEVSHVRTVSRAGSAGVLVALLLLLAQVLPVGAASGGFGAKLDKTSQPANAEGGQRCDDHGGIPTGSACTWVATQAYRNAGQHKAPRDGTIGKVKLVSCVQGSFRLQFARVRPAQDTAKVVRNGPVIRYAADPRQIDGDEDTYCGGEDGTDYQVQTFRVNVPVRKGESIAFKAKRTGTLYCSGDSGVDVYAPPLAVGGSFRTATDDTSCLMLVRLVYK